MPDEIYQKALSLMAELNEKGDDCRPEESALARDLETYFWWRDIRIGNERGTKNATEN